VVSLLVLYVVSGILLILLAIPLIRKKIKPNGLYGFRVKQTMSDPELWYAVNCYSGKWLLFCGVVIVFSSIFFYLIPGISVDAYALICLAVFILVFAISLGKSWQFMKKESAQKSI